MPRSPVSILHASHRWCFVLFLALWTSAMGAPCAAALCCVWRVTDDAGHTLYLAGSIHVLRASDYPLPAPYEQAYQASTSLAFETDLTAKGNDFSRALGAAALYPHDGKLQDHVDPRTYAYLLRVISNVHGSTEPEKHIEHLRPWAISFELESPGGLQGISSRSGVEWHFIEKAKRDHKETDGLVPFRDHIAVFGKMNDADSEATLLLAFINLNTDGKVFAQTLSCWKRGDMAGLEKIVEDEYRDAPGVRQRMLSERNATWMPKLEGYLRSGKTWTVLAGTAHMAGDDGVPALLRARGYHVEQL